MKNFILLFLLTMLFYIAGAQNKPSFYCAFNHMAFPVKNLEVSVDFYKRILNLNELTTVRVQGRKVK